MADPEHRSADGDDDDRSIDRYAIDQFVGIDQGFFFSCSFHFSSDWVRRLFCLGGFLLNDCPLLQFSLGRAVIGSFIAPVTPFGLNSAMGKRAESGSVSIETFYG